MAGGILLSAAAREDIVDALVWTQERFGENGRRRYEVLIATALRDLAADPFRGGSIDRAELGECVRSYHLRHSRDRARQAHGPVRRPRHFLLYRVTPAGAVGVGRLLHDAMELERHLPASYGDE
ncbi:type II toxin-antitoxin system RelE/ParE family toxin [Zavarzinia aquatilis]|uniref:Plasmid stabilization protein ParE n=1 Tax=Zavarzinia aquatilis TaxID=2211142 RepID=A0A317ECX6_9PROT|nr:type II toxin-antitoxin system RelE/ParE family toxin [Zavarzinia aquatilis]PWR24878.1 plasmid stabilization protein ParE [Zavarzinia aquatilis]